MKITISFSQVEGPAVAALTQNLADIMTALTLQGTQVELSFQCEPSQEPELPTELTTQEDYAAAQAALLEALGDDDPLEAPYLPH